MKVKKEKLILPIAAAVCLVAVIGMILSLVIGKSNNTVEFTPPPFDENAVYGVPTAPENLGWGELDAKVYKASVCGVVIVEDGKADVWLTNPDSNTVWLKLRVLDEQGNILGETGLIKPGEYVQSVNFDTVPTDGAAITLKLMAYEPETYYSAGSVVLSTTASKGGA